MSVHSAVEAHARRLVDVIGASGNVRKASADAGIHHSTYYRWKHRFEHRDLTPVRVMSFVDRQLEAEVVALSLANPGFGPQRVSDELALRGVVAGPSRVWRIMKRNRINTRTLRYQLLATHRDPVDPQIVVAVKPQPVGRLDAETPGDLIQFDCFHVGSFKETRFGADKKTRGQVWQYTAIDVASSYLWVELETSHHNPDPAVASRLAHRVAADLTDWEWTWKAATTDNGNEYRAQLFRDTLQTLEVEHRYIKAGRPQTNGKAERVQGTLLEEFYQPTLIAYTEPSITGLRTDLNAYVHHYNWKRPHRGKWNQGKTPAQIIQPKTRITNP
jgi:transposase InsO family protein